MARQLPLSRQMGLAIAVLGLIAIVPAVMELRALDAYRDASDSQERGSAVVRAVDQAEVLLVDLQTGGRGFVIAGDKRFLEPWLRAREELPTALTAVVAATEPESRQRALALRFSDESRTYLHEFSEPFVELAEADRAAAVAQIADSGGGSRLEEVRATGERLVRSQDAANRAATDRADAASDRARTTVIAGLVALLVALAAAAIYVSRRIARPLRRLTETAERLGTGEAAARAERGGPREIDQLAATFNDMAAALQRGREELEEASEAKSEFLSRMSHELRTPLNAVLGFGQLLEMSELDEDDADSVRQVLHAGRHLLTLIDEVLDISRIETGTLRISLEPVPVADAIADARSMIGPLAANRGIALTVEPIDQEVHCLADQQRLKQILLNLLTNAINYNRPDGAVAVRAEADQEAVRILVTDTGRGIPTEQLDKLFAPFERLGADQTEVQGTGLGLALSLRLAELMGGTLLVTATGDAGTTFTLSLQRARAAELGAEEVDVPESQSAADQRPLTVVYIEDNMSNFKLVERIFARARPLRLLTAIQGSLGIELIRRHRPDLVLLDLHLPDMTGEQALAELKADPETSQIPVIVVSADATSGQIARLRAGGAAAYLTKPLDVREFLATVDSTLAKADAP